MNNEATNIISFENEKGKSLFKQMLDKENECIAQAQKDKNEINRHQGFKDPRNDEILRKGLQDTFRGRNVRIFIQEYKYIPASQLDKNKQPRDELAIKDYCENDLIPRIKKEGLRFIPFVSDSNVLDAGHNRTYSLEYLFPDQDIPIFVLGEPYYINDDDTIEILSGVEKSYYRTRSRSRTNPKAEHQEMTMASVASCIRDLYDIDPTFNGLNPSSQKFASVTCKYFNNVMDEEFPGYFVHKTPRSKIFKMIWDESSRQKAKIKPLTEIQKTGLLRMLKWDDGLKENGKKRKSFGEHVDISNSAYIAMTNTNGNNFEAIVINNLINKFVDNKLEVSLQKMFVFCEVYKPEKNNINLKQQRETFLVKCSDYNNKAKKLRIVEIDKEKKEKISTAKLPLLEKVYFPKQLSTPADNGSLYEWDLNEEKFVLI